MSDIADIRSTLQERTHFFDISKALKPTKESTHQVAENTALTIVLLQVVADVVKVKARLLRIECLTRSAYS